MQLPIKTYLAAVSPVAESVYRLTLEVRAASGEVLATQDIEADVSDGALSAVLQAADKLRRETISRVDLVALAAACIAQNCPIE